MTFLKLKKFKPCFGISFLVLIISTNCIASDSLSFINRVKLYAFQNTSFTPKSPFYTQWNNENKPYVYLYVSDADSVQKPDSLQSSFVFFNTDQNWADEEARKWIALGFETFCYKTYANSSAQLNLRLLSYPEEAIAFIVFHELIHVYLEQMQIHIPYEFNEALCDVIGNYGTIAFAKEDSSIRLSLAKAQIRRNERVYLCLNKTMSQIHKKPSLTNRYTTRSNKQIHRLLKRANAFQKDRFDFPVNTAYLLKNEYYCKNYFLLKRVFLKQNSIQDFLEIIKNLPENTSNIEAYLGKFL